MFDIQAFLIPPHQEHIPSISCNIIAMASVNKIKHIKVFHIMIKSMLIAGCGGFAGTCGRFLMGKLCAHMFHGSFPMSTFMVNLLGCFLIGLFFGIIEKHHIMTPEENLLLITGFCGGFTTFSTFANDIWVLGNKGSWTICALYLAASVICGIILVWTGRAIIK